MENEITLTIFKNVSFHLGFLLKHKISALIKINLLLAVIMGTATLTVVFKASFGLGS